MRKFDKNDYKKEVDRIHAPKDLIERTRAAMLKEEERMAEEEPADNTKPAGEIKPAEDSVCPGEINALTKTGREKGKNRDRTVFGKIYRWRRYAAAACIVFLLFAGYGVYRYRADHDIHIQELASFEGTEGCRWELGVSLGQADGVASEEESKGEEESDSFRVSSGRDKSIAPKELWEAEESRIKGNKVYIVYVEEEKAYYAAWKDGDVYCLAAAENTTEKEFLKNLKKNIENR